VSLKHNKPDAIHVLPFVLVIIIIIITLFPNQCSKINTNSENRTSRSGKNP